MARGQALDRIPTVNDIREIIDAVDQRGKALTLVFLTSGVREGAIEYFTMQDYSTIQKEGKKVAGRLVELSIKKEKSVNTYTGARVPILVTLTPAQPPARPEKVATQAQNYNDQAPRVL